MSSQVIKEIVFSPLTYLVSWLTSFSHCHRKEQEAILHRPFFCACDRNVWNDFAIIAFISIKRASYYNTWNYPGSFRHSTPSTSLVLCTVTNGRNIKAKLSTQQQQINTKIVCLQYMVRTTNKTADHCQLKVIELITAFCLHVITPSKRSLFNYETLLPVDSKNSSPVSQIMEAEVWTGTSSRGRKKNQNIPRNLFPPLVQHKTRFLCPVFMCFICLTLNQMMICTMAGKSIK